MNRIVTLGLLMTLASGAMAENVFYVGLGGQTDFLKFKVKMSEAGVDSSKNATKGSFDGFGGWHCQTCGKFGMGLEVRAGVPMGTSKSKITSVKAGETVSGDGFEAIKASASDTLGDDAITDTITGLTNYNNEEGQEEARKATYDTYIQGWVTNYKITPTILVNVDDLGYVAPTADNIPEDAEFKLTALTFEEEQTVETKVKRKPFMSLLAMASLKLSDKVRLYLTGGLKFWKVSITGEGSFMGNTISVHSSKTELTPLIGAGIQTDFKENWFARLEYMHDLKENINNTPKKNIMMGLKKSKVSSHAVRLALGYKF